MTWDAHYRRKDLLKAAVEIVNSGETYTLPTLLHRIDPERAAFADEASLLREAQLAWFQRLSGTLDQRVDDSTSDSAEAARMSWATAAETVRGMRIFLDAHTGHPALAVGLRNERIMMAQMAGATPAGIDAEAYGKQLISEACERANYRVEAAGSFGVVDGDRPSGLVARLRSVLAA